MMVIKLSELRKVKGIGPKAMERVFDHLATEKDRSKYESKYNPSKHLTVGEVYLGDCLDKMEGIPSKSVDLILTDLPYGTTASNWDSIICFETLWKHYERIITDNGAIVLFSSGQFTNKLINSNTDLYRYKWIWEKTRTGNFVNANNRPLTSYEEICVFSKGITANTSNEDLKMNYYPQGLKRVDKKVVAGSSKFGSMHGKRPGHRAEYIAKYTNYPKDILKYPSVGKPVHPTEKPVPLLEYLIKTYSKENEVVLDNTMGSGSTGEASINTNRQFIGIELDEEYYKIAMERIEEAKERN